MRGSHSFAATPKADIPRSVFQRDHSYKTTFNSGYLIPFYVDEALPGDTFKLNVNVLARMNTPIVPLMDNLYLDVFFFAIPNRLVWDNWEKFCGAQTDPGDSIDYELPALASPGVGGFPVGWVGDYMGLPVLIQYFDKTVTSLPLRSYVLVWNEWFRDQNLQDSIPLDTSDATSSWNDYPLLRRGKRKDYFTSCLPWPQKGPASSVLIQPTQTGGVNDGPTFFNAAQSSLERSLDVSTGSSTVKVSNSTPSATESLHWADPALQATVESIREAFQIQRLLERDARGGTRYVEVLKAHFGVTSPDARLQRPEYLGGASIPVSINPVAQTSATDAAVSPQGNLSAFGVVGGRAGFTKSFVEHCYLLGLVSVRADLSYQMGVNRLWIRRTRYDFYWPALAHLGEQEVYQMELEQGTLASVPAPVFGYQERYGEYRYHPSYVTAQMRSAVYLSGLASYDVWHLAQTLSSPVLDGTFIEENPPVNRVVAVPDEPEFILDSFFSVRCARPMPMYSVPGLVDHF